MAVARELMLTYLLFCNHIFDDSNFDTPNSYGHIFTLKTSSYSTFEISFLLKLKTNYKFYLIKELMLQSFCIFQVK